MKTAKETIIEALKEEIPDMTETKYEKMALHIKKVLRIENDDISEPVKNERLRYDVEFGMSEVQCVERCSMAGLYYIDPLYIRVVKLYLDAIGVKRVRTKEICEEKYILRICEESKLEKGIDIAVYTDNPVTFITTAINMICDAYSICSTLEKGMFKK